MVPFLKVHIVTIPKKAGFFFVSCLYVQDLDIFRFEIRATKVSGIKPALLFLRILRNEHNMFLSEFYSRVTLALFDTIIKFGFKLVTRTAPS